LTLATLLLEPAERGLTNALLVATLALLVLGLAPIARKAAGAAGLRTPTARTNAAPSTPRLAVQYRISIVVVRLSCPVCRIEEKLKPPAFPSHRAVSRTAREVFPGPVGRGPPTAGLLDWHLLRILEEVARWPR
jgi:hypothetical protein